MLWNEGKQCISVLGSKTDGWCWGYWKTTSTKIRLVIDRNLDHKCTYTLPSGNHYVATLPTYTSLSPFGRFHHVSPLIQDDIPKKKLNVDRYWQTVIETISLVLHLNNIYFMFYIKIYMAIHYQTLWKWIRTDIRENFNRNQRLKQQEKGLHFDK